MNAGFSPKGEEMAVHVDKATLKKTTRCRRDFECLESGVCSGCEIKPVGRDDKFLVKPKGDSESCPYLTELGFASHICRCPTRVEIYRRYRT
jgi:hypothetical protein